VPGNLQRSLPEQECNAHLDPTCRADPWPGLFLKVVAGDEMREMTVWRGPEGA